jgi:hypothetical protein
MVNPLTAVLQTVQEPVTALDELLEAYAENDKNRSRLMTAPGIGGGRGRGCSIRNQPTRRSRVHSAMPLG